ncbi:uncharacterized protein LOC135117167 [Helicoverpa armigera]|uniref:uncharacterized protein LOC135117167 n=1 Tax=Helicoverpa armigera TaxID=29058 RepID=UPI003083CEE2
MFNSPPHQGVVTRKARARLEQEQRDRRSACQQMDIQGDDAAEVGQNATQPSFQTATGETMHQKEFPCTENKVGSSIKSEPLLHERVCALPTKPAYSCVSKGSQKSLKSKSARIKLQLEAAKQKAKIQMELIDKTLEAQLAELSDEEELEEYSSQCEGNVPPQSDIEEWVKHQSNHFEPQTEQQAPAHGIKSGELQQAVPSSTPARQHVSFNPLQGMHAVPPAPASVHAPPASQPLPQPDDDTITALRNTVQVLAGALKDLSTSNVNSGPDARLLSRLSTPKDLPEFAGDPMDWLLFKQAYDESTEMCRFTDKENLWRLRKCLKGSARDAVAALFISAASPDKVISTLALRFGNPDCIVSRVLQDVKKLHPLQPDYHKDIVPFAVKVQNYVEAVRALGREEYLQGVSIVPMILCKLPPVLISKWSDYSYNLIAEGKIPRCASTPGTGVAAGAVVIVTAAGHGDIDARS